MFHLARRTGRRTLTLAATAALLISACGTSSPVSRETPTAVPPTAVPPSPSPVATPSDAERFWSSLELQAAGPRYASVAEIGGESDAVVVGRVTGVRFAYEQRDLGAEAGGQSRESASVYYGEIKLAVEQVLTGDLLEPGVVRLMVILGSPNMVADLQELLPSGRALLFLVDPVRLFGDMGDPGLREAERGKHLLTNVDQSVVIEVGGRVAPQRASEGPPSFLVAFDGRPFDEVVEEVRAAVR